MVDVISDAQSRRATSKVSQGELRKAKECLTTKVEFAESSKKTFEQLEGKHPARLAPNEMTAEDLAFIPPKDTLLTVTTAEVWQAIKSAAKGSSPGIDGLRFDHLYDIGQGGTHAYLKPLTAFTNLALQGVLPQWYYTFVASADLIALAKSDGGIRPIAMGSIWRKLFSKAALVHLKEDIQRYFALYQYGVGSRSGCEVVNHRARMLLKANPTHVLFKTDFSNAFNSLYRKQILCAVKQHFPGLFPLVSAVYAPKASLWTKIDESGRRAAVSSEEGVQQGDALGPFLFCLVLQPLLVALNERLNGAGKSLGEALGEMDDLTMVLDPDVVGDTADFISNESAKLGLKLNFSKCELMSMDGKDALSGIICDSNIKHVDGCVKNLGIPIGTDSACGAYWHKYLDEIARETRIVCAWSNVQAALVLFRLCITSKLNYMLRSVPPLCAYADPLVSRATFIMKGGLALILGLNPLFANLAADNSWWLQGSLPPTMGGFGIVDPSLIHYVSFLACEAGVSDSISALQIARNLPPFQPSADARSCYDSKCVDKDHFPDLEIMYIESHKLQHRLSVELYKRRSTELRSRGCDVAQRLDSCSEEGAILITCIPKDPTLTISDGAKMRERLCMRAGLAVPYIQCGPCLCGEVGAYVDEFNFHLLSGCRRGGERLKNHNGVRDTLLEFFRQGGMSCRPGGREVCLAHEPGTKKSVDMTVNNYDGLIPMGVDISVVDPRSTKFKRVRTSIAAGAAAKDREEHKIRKYQDAYVSQHVLFEPFVLESFGRFGNGTRALFNQVVDRICAVKDQHVAAYQKPYWKARIVMALHINACHGVKDRMEGVLARRGGLASGEVLSSDSRKRVDCEMFARARY
jgi:hypothetical protein